MKIAQVCPYNIFRSGGVQSHVLNLSEELRKRGHEVKIIAPKTNRVDNSNKDFILAGTCTEVSFNKTQIELSIAFGKKQKLLEEVLEEENFDILHFHEPWVPVLSMQILSMSNSVNIGTFHSATTKTFFSRSFEAMLMPIASYIVKALDEVISVSEVPAKYLRQFYAGRINIVPNGIDLKTFKPQNKPFKKYRDGKINILFVGRLDKRKGVIYLIKAFQKLKKKVENIRLLVAGKGDELRKLKNYVKKKKMEDVEFLGFVEEKDKPRWYATCDIFCSPALYGESFGIVLLEAMATGKPVVACANPGYKSVMQARGSLLLTKPKDKEDLKNKLEALCLDKELRNFMGDWGKNEVKKYSWKEVCDGVCEVYEQAVHKKRRKVAKDDVEKIIERWSRRLQK